VSTINAEDLPVVKAADQDGYDGGYVALFRNFSAWGETATDARVRCAKIINSSNKKQDTYGNTK
jgi:hypothetical protein